MASEIRYSRVVRSDDRWAGTLGHGGILFAFGMISILPADGRAVFGARFVPEPATAGQRTRGLRPGREENSTFTSFTSREALAPFTPLLRIGECIHVGKNAVFGNGWFVIRETVAGRR